MIYREIRRRTKLPLGPAIAFIVMGYFLYHTIEGNHGLRAWWHLEDELVQANEKLHQIEPDQLSLERQVSLLRPSSLCTDMLSEEAHKLGLVHRNEVVMLHSD